MSRSTRQSHRCKEFKPFDYACRMSFSSFASSRTPPWTKRVKAHDQVLLQLTKMINDLEEGRLNLLEMRHFYHIWPSNSTIWWSLMLQQPLKSLVKAVGLWYWKKVERHQLMIEFQSADAVICYSAWSILICQPKRFSLAIGFAGSPSAASLDYSSMRALE